MAEPTNTPAASSPRVTVAHHDEPLTPEGTPRPTMTPHLSDPPNIQSFASPMRQHRRTPSVHREVKETLDARVEYASDESDGTTQHKINQYTIFDEIGRGSYGAVHLATDQYGNEYAVKEFSKARLRKRAQSHILRQGPHRRPMFDLPRAPQSGFGFGAPASAQAFNVKSEEDALHLIREEIAIMKKLNHPNLVQLIEVLDDPEEDSLYMVMEMCKKGVIMKIGLDEQVDPYSEEQCRFWFRDLILGIEYLHTQNVIHRDIKPDNLLLSEDEVLKVVDFGVSEMFEKPDDMRTSKSAGSPAFLPPELCGKHSEISGKAADIWSMGVSLFCLLYGRIPFKREVMVEIYEAIKTESPELPTNANPDLVDLFSKILDKNPETRIKMPQLRDHPWVTKGGTDPLLSKEENCANPVEPPNELEVSRAFTRKMNHLLCVMKAIHRFKQTLAGRRSAQQSIYATSVSGHFDPAEEKARAKQIEELISRRREILSGEGDAREEEKSHAHNVTEHEHLFLGIGTGSRDDFAMDEATPDVVADSPKEVDFNVYDRAYEDAVEQHLKQTSGHRPTLYLTKFVKEKEYFKKVENLVEGTANALPDLKEHVKQSRQHVQQQLQSPKIDKLASLAAKVGISNDQEAKSSTEK